MPTAYRVESIKCVGESHRRNHHLLWALSSIPALHVLSPLVPPLPCNVSVHVPLAHHRTLLVDGATPFHTSEAGLPEVWHQEPAFAQQTVGQAFLPFLFLFFIEHISTNPMRYYYL